MRPAFLPLLLAALPAQAQDVAKIFASNCAGCHNTQAKMGNFDLASQQDLARVVKAGKSGESRLFLLVSGGAAPAMPMGGRPLAPGEIDAIKKWIDSGAPKLDISAKMAVPDIKPRTPVKSEIGALAWRPDGRMLALGGFREVRLADPAGKALATLPGHAEVVRAVAFSRDGKMLAAAGGKPAQSGEVKIWDVESKNAVRTIAGHTDSIYAVAFSPDGKSVATASYDKLIKLWDVASGAEIRTFKDHIDAVYALAFTPDGQRLVSGAADRTVKIWNAATGERLYTLSEPLDGLNTIALSPDGRMVAAGGMDKTIRIWTLGERAGTLVHSLIAHEDAILRLAWSPDGQYLASSGADRVIKLFRASDLTELKTMPGQADWVMSLEFAPDGTRLAAGRFDGSLEIYPEMHRLKPVPQ